MFLSNGEFNYPTIDFFSKVVPQYSRKDKNYNKMDKAEQKSKYWIKKDMVGIVPKMVVNKIYKKKLGLTIDDINYNNEFYTYKNIIKPIWTFILTLKYNQNEKLRNLLKDTDNVYLLEFDRSAERLHKLKKSSFWGGMIKNDILIGKNMMGIILMKVRDNILNNCEEL